MNCKSNKIECIWQWQLKSKSINYSLEIILRHSVRNLLLDFLGWQFSSNSQQLLRAIPIAYTWYPEISMLVKTGSSKYSKIWIRTV